MLHRAIMALDRIDDFAKPSVSIYIDPNKAVEKSIQLTCDGDDPDAILRCELQVHV